MNARPLRRQANSTSAASELNSNTGLRFGDTASGPRVMVTASIWPFARNETRSDVGETLPGAVDRPDHEAVVAVRA